MRFRTGPKSIWMIRHGQSMGNVARDQAELEGHESFEIETRDADTPLSAEGEVQARAFGQWLGRQPDDELPTAVIASTYVRARDTARIAMDAAGGELASLPIDTDERLRDRELGVLDSLTWHGIRTLHPKESERAIKLGRFYYRPPGGESWADMKLRLRSLLGDVAREYTEDRILIVAHDVSIQLIASIIDGLNEAEIIDLVLNTKYANCALTQYDAGDDGYRLVRYNFTAPIAESDAAVTEEEDVKAGPR